jgi:hypothetical protein
LPGVGRDKAEGAAKALFRTVKDHLPPELRQSLFSAIPGAAEMAVKYEPASPCSSGIEGMMADAMKSVFGMTDPLAAAPADPKGAGLSSSQALQTGIVFMRFVGDKAGKDVLKQMADEIPGLSRLH